MTKEEIIRELNVCDFQDRQVLAELGVMAQGAMWMQKKMIDKACKWIEQNAVNYCDEDTLAFCAYTCVNDFRKAMNE